MDSKHKVRLQAKLAAQRRDLIILIQLHAFTVLLKVNALTLAGMISKLRHRGTLLKPRKTSTERNSNPSSVHSALLHCPIHDLTSKLESVEGTSLEHSTSYIRDILHMPENKL